MDIKRAWETRPRWAGVYGTCHSSRWDAWSSTVRSKAWEWQVWFDQEVLGHMYDVEFISNGVTLGADYQLSKATAMESARSFAYADSWAFLASKVYGPDGEVVFDTTVRQPTAQELREHAEHYKDMGHMALEYQAMVEYAEYVENQEKA